MKAWRRSGGLGPVQCGLQVASVVVNSIGDDLFLVAWAPITQGITLTIERSLNLGPWTVIVDSESDSTAEVEFGTLSNPGDTIQCRIRRQGSDVSCAVYSTVTLVEF